MRVRKRASERSAAAPTAVAPPTSYSYSYCSASHPSAAPPAAEDETAEDENAEDEAAADVAADAAATAEEPPPATAPAASPAAGSVGMASLTAASKQEVDKELGTPASAEHDRPEGGCVGDISAAEARSSNFGIAARAEGAMGRAARLGVPPGVPPPSCRRFSRCSRVIFPPSKKGATSRLCGMATYPALRCSTAHVPGLRVLQKLGPVWRPSSGPNGCSMCLAPSKTW